MSNQLLLTAPVRREVEKTAKAAQQYVETRVFATEWDYLQPQETRPGIEKILVELDGSHIRTGKKVISEGVELTPKRQLPKYQRQIGWREVRVGLARRYAEAEPLYLKSLQLLQSLLGEEHPHVAASYNNLAELYNSQGRYAEAEDLYLKALQLKQRLLGEEHPDVAISYNNLAELYKSQGRYGEAEPLYLKALKIAELSLGINHSTTITVRENLKLLHDRR